MWRLLDKVHQDDYPARVLRMCILWGFLGVFVNFFTLLHIVNNSEWQIENYVGAVFGILAIVVFLAYLKLMKERKLILKDVDNFLTESGSKDESIDRLRIRLSAGLHLLNKPVNTELEFKRWKTDDKNWVSAVYRELKTSFNESLAESFQSVESMQEIDIVPSFNSEHNTRKLVLNKRLNNLINIIKESI
jgi:hypothetical protein